ncbi:MAG: M23 family metallopeptidase [Acidobacteria bacterium]|nr:M23 family metallopeptidase [Acidobacteriota bacterium]
MLKNDKAYVFFLTHRSKSRIFIKRVEIARRFVNFGAVACVLFAVIAATSFGITRILSNTAFAETAQNASIFNRIAAQPPAQNDIIIENQQQPSDEEIALNSGGPANDTELDGEDQQLDSELKAIAAKADPTYLPTEWAHLGKINNEFGFRRNPFGGRAYEFHPGMDIDGERGDLVTASANGTVIKAAYTNGYGNMVEIDHGNGLVTRYGHMSKLEVSTGDVVTRGQLIGEIGSTGRSTGPHLHFELRYNDKPINPRHFLKPEPTDLTNLPK